MKTITFNAAYLRAMLLEDMRQLAIPAKALAEILILRAHYGTALRRFAEARDAITADEQADEATKNAAVESKAAEDSGCRDRRLTPDTFAAVVEAAVAAGEINSAVASKTVRAAEWLEALTYDLADYEG